MSKKLIIAGFSTINYTRLTCRSCSAVTVIEPGQTFDGKMNCTCKAVAPVKMDADEISVPVQEELDYMKSQTVTVIGRFKDGDYEVINSNDSTDSWRVPKDTFESTFESTYELLAATLTAPATDVDQMMIDIATVEDLVKYSEVDQLVYAKTILDLVNLEDEPPVGEETVLLIAKCKSIAGVTDEEVTKTETVKAALSLDSLSGKSTDEIKTEFTMDQLRVIAKDSGIKSYHNMKEDKLIKKLLEKAAN